MGTLKPMTPLRPLIQASMKPPSPLLAPNKGALKPASPLRPKTAPKTPISRPQRRWRFQSRIGRRPQRRWRFQLGLGRRPQRRRWFQPHTDASKQRRHRFQESGPPGLQDPDAIPVGGGGAWPDNEPTHRATRQYTRPHRCGGRRRDLPRCRWAPEGPAAVPVGGGGAWPGFEPTHPATRQYTKRRRCGGRRRVRRAQAGFEIDHSEPQARVWRSRGRAAAHRHTQRPGPPAPETPVGPQAARPASTTQRNEAATGCPATASSRSRSAVHNSATSNQAVMST